MRTSRSVMRVHDRVTKDTVAGALWVGVACAGIAVASVVPASAAGAATLGTARPGDQPVGAAQTPASLAAAGHVLLGAASVLGDANQFVADRGEGDTVSASTVGHRLMADDGRLRDDVDALDNAVAPNVNNVGGGTNGVRRPHAANAENDSAVRADIAALVGDVGQVDQVTGRAQAVALESLDGANDALSEDIDALLDAGATSGRAGP